MDGSVTDQGLILVEREEMAKAVREAWSMAVKEVIKDPPASWKKSFEELPEHMKETERRQGDLLLGAINDILVEIGVADLLVACLIPPRKSGGIVDTVLWSLQICGAINEYRKKQYCKSIRRGGTNAS